MTKYRVVDDVIKEYEPRHINWPGVLTTGLLLITYMASLIISSFISGDAFIGSFIIGIVVFILWFGIGAEILEEWKPLEFRFLWIKPKPKTHYIAHLDPRNEKHLVYDTAIKDCIEEIKDGSVDYNFWVQTFKGLNTVCEEKQVIKKKERVDYIQWQREVNAMRPKELQ